MWSYNYTQQSDELYHYGVLGMKWGQRKAQYQQKQAAINRYRNQYNKELSGKSCLAKAYSKLTGADKIYAKTRYNMSKQSSKSNSRSTSSSKTSQQSKSTKSTTKKSSEAKKTVQKAKTTGKKATNKVLKKSGNTAVKSVGKAAKVGASMLQTMYLNPMAAEARQFGRDYYIDALANRGASVYDRYD